MTKDKTIVDGSKIVEKLLALHENSNPDILHKILDKFFKEIKIALVCGDRVEIRGLGSFTVRKRSEKNVRNPKTMEKIIVQPKGSVYFRASKVLLKSLNGGNSNK